MSRRLLIDLLAGQAFTRVVLRGKCGMWEWTGRGDACGESVRLVDGEWWGESSRSFECLGAPQDPCPTCHGVGEVEISAAEAELLRYDGTEAAQRLRKPCTTCRGLGYVPGPHWPFRHDCPPPLRIRT